MNEKHEKLNEAIGRVKRLQFGEQVTNVCAGSDNPRKHSLFCQYVLQQNKNRFGIVHKSHYAKCTDGKGNFWKTDVAVIFKGHLSDEKCKELHLPIWQLEFKENQ